MSADEMIATCPELNYPPGLDDHGRHVWKVAVIGMMQESTSLGLLSLGTMRELRLEAKVAELEAENALLRDDVRKLADKLAACAEVLAKRAERKDAK